MDVYLGDGNVSRAWAIHRLVRAVVPNLGDFPRGEFGHRGGGGGGGGTFKNSTKTSAGFKKYI